MLFVIIKALKKYYDELARPIVSYTVDPDTKIIILFDKYGDRRRINLSKKRMMMVHGISGKKYYLNSVEGQFMTYEILDIIKLLREVQKN